MEEVVRMPYMLSMNVRYNRKNGAIDGGNMGSTHECRLAFEDTTTPDVHWKANPDFLLGEMSQQKVD